MHYALKQAKDAMNGKQVKVAECGVCDGMSSLDILNEWPEAFVYLIDDYSARALTMLEKCIVRLKGFTDRTQYVLREQYEASKQFDDETLDAVYMDFTVDVNLRKYYLECWYPKVRKGGYFCGKNYQANQGDRKNEDLISTFAKDRGEEVHVHKQGQWNWWIIKGDNNVNRG